MPGPVVDTASAQEFLREALGKISLSDLDAVVDSLEDKHHRFRALLGPERSTPLGEAEVRTVLRSVFATRRRADDLLGSVGADALAEGIGALVRGPDPVQDRFQAFVESLGGVTAQVAVDLASEVLHFTDPARYWLWTRWLWDPATRTGALRLLAAPGVELDGGSPGATYLRVGEALMFVREAGRVMGFARVAPGDFGLDVFLACVYGVYVHTAVRLRMTQEFNRVLPPLPELCRRLLGTWKPEV
jgi:hypothetical protein